MNVLVVNTGSSSCKLAVVDGGGAVRAARSIDPWDGDAALVEHAVADLLDDHDVAAVGHRVVHGGQRFTGPALLDDQAVDAIAALEPLAPLHQPRAVLGIRAARAALGDVPAVACFDTAFHATIPEPARTYAIPAAWRERHGIRRYGFHGLSHRAGARRAAELAGAPLEDLRVVTAHLGGGASLCAVQGGRSVDTTMGFTPLEGLVMTTRSGTVDPGLVLWLQQEAGLDVAEVADALERRSGLAGLAELAGDAPGDLRRILPAAHRGDPRAELAVAVYLHRLRAHVAAMAAAMGGLDVLAFTGGAGEGQPEIRARTVEQLAFLGLAIDAEANAAARGDADISAPGARARTVSVATREDAEIAREVRAMVSREQNSAGPRWERALEKG